MDESSTPVVLGTSRAGIGSLLATLDVGRPSRWSPLVDVVPPDQEPAWPGETAALSPDVSARLRVGVLPLTAPDRRLDLWTAAYEGTPVPARLGRSRRHGATWGALRPGTTDELELVGPLTDDDVVRWGRLHLESSAGVDVPVPWDTLDGRQLAFVLALVDAHTAAAHAAFGTRRTQPAPVVVHRSDILRAQTEALRVRDRRWLATALLELFDLLVHPGGRRRVGLPPVDDELVRSEVQRYLDAGWLKPVSAGADPGMRLAGPLLGVAATLPGWLQLVCLHDSQITGWSDGTAVVQHDAVVLVVGPTTTWALATTGLGTAGSDLAEVAFRLQTVNAVTGERLLGALLAELPAPSLPDACYAEATRDLPSDDTAPPPPAVPPPTTATLPPPSLGGPGTPLPPPVS